MATTTKAPAQAAEPIITVSDAGPCRKRLDVEIPAAMVTSEVGASMSMIADSTQLPGFRRGKAPARLIERVFGKTARDEVKQKLVSTAFQKAVNDHQLKVLGDPEGGDELAEMDLASGKPIRFSVEVEVAPEFSPPTLENIPVKKPIFEATDALVTEEIERVAVQEGELLERDAAEPGDYCIGKGTIKDSDGKTALEIEGAVIQIPSKGDKGAVLGVMVEDFATQAGLPKAGTILKIKATGPASHEVVSIRGKPITIEFDVAKVNRIVPMPVATLVSRLGMPSEKELRDEVMNRLRQRLLIRQQTHMRRQIADYLIEKTSMTLPEKLTERQAARNVERRRLDLMYRGFNPVQVEEQVAEYRNASQDDARRELKLFFILDRVAKDLNVQVTEPEVNGRIAQLAAERGVRPERLRAELIQRGQAPLVLQQIREHKAMDALLGRCKVEDVPGEAFEKSLPK